MTPRERLLCFFHSLCGHSMRQNCLSTGFSPSALSRNNQLCIEILTENFAWRMIKWPTLDEMETEAMRFVEAYGGPKSMFLVADGTFIKGLSSLEYLNCKIRLVFYHLFQPLSLQSMKQHIEIDMGILL